MKISLELLAVIVGAGGLILAGVQWIVSNAIKKGADSRKLDDTHDKIKEYDKKSVECREKFVWLEEGKAGNKAVEDVRMDIFRLSEKLDAVLSGSNTKDLIQAHSPLTLTEVGWQMAAEMKMEERIDRNWGKIHEFLDSSLESMNPYDVQQFCFGTASVFPERFFADEDVEFVKTYAYNKGKTIAYYGSMIGVMIRDKYFKYKGIDVADVDKHDPAKQA